VSAPSDNSAACVDGDDDEDVPLLSFPSNNEPAGVLVVPLDPYN
jgi:hypothetical protein